MIQKPSIDSPYLSLISYERFNVHMQEVLNLQVLIPSHVKSSRFDELIPLLVKYGDHIPGSIPTVKDEFERWQTKWSNQPLDECPRNAIDCLSMSWIQDFYPNIHRLLILFATLPVTTASVERSFSCLKRLKSHLRTTMGQDRMSGLAMMEINRSAVPLPTVVIDKLAQSKRKFDIII